MSRRALDAIVVGGGVVGAAAALAMARAGRRVALVEARAPLRWSPEAPLDLRVFAFAPSSRILLERLGVWPVVVEARVQPYRRMRVWDAASTQSLAFDAADVGQPELGHIVEQSLLLDALWRVLEPVGVDCRCPVRVQDLQVEADGIAVQLDDGSRLRAAVLLAADGGASPLRQRLGIEVAGYDYDQRGLVAFVRTEHPHEDTAWQRFLPGGPLAFLPFVDGLCSIVWTLPDAEAGRLRSCARDAFERELERAFESRLGAVELASERAAFPLRRQLAQRYVHGRAVLLGDAAHLVHPLAGQGVNLGLGDVASLVAALGEEELPRGEALGRALRRYERQRRSENAMAAWAFDGLNRLFSNDAVLPTLLRGPALGLVDRIPPLKRFFIARAAGW
ncbi:MAG TPA: FAD-dependent oxidoreductase [Xanthomonadaceae bacterium]|nr:FAD-dependent oxidoreductase [Xanthomonadaceae bacterium]